MTGLEFQSYRNLAICFGEQRIENMMSNFVGGIQDWFQMMYSAAVTTIKSGHAASLMYTAAARWIFILLAAFILIRAIIALLRSKSPSEVWAYLHIEGSRNIPITHWENAIGRAPSCDIQLEDMSVSRNQGTLVRDNNGYWTYMDLGSRNGAYVNGKKAVPYKPVIVGAGDKLVLGSTACELFPVSVQEHMNNIRRRAEYTHILPPWMSFLALTLFQFLTVVQLKLALGTRYAPGITVAFAGLAVVMWVYVIAMKIMHRRGFEIETIAFFLSTLSLSVVATRFPTQVLKQFLTIVIGVLLFLFMCTWLRDLKRTLKVKKLMYIAAMALFAFNLVFATTKNGQSNWVQLGGFSMQPSEIVKLAFIWVGAATMNELFERKNSMIFTAFAFFCFLCLAKMGDFGTAVIFFVTYLVISFLRSGDFTRLIMIVGVAFAGGMVVLRFKSYIAARLAVWGHVWESSNANAMGYQQTRTMSASASGGLIGVGAGKGWFHTIFASETDLVFGTVSEEWGLIIAILMIIAIVTLAVFAYRSIWAGRSTYYTIAACAATTIFLFQAILNFFGSVDLLPLTGVTFPFVSGGGTSMIASWGLLAFVKAADTRQNASIAVSLDDQGLTSEGAEHYEEA